VESAPDGAMNKPTLAATKRPANRTRRIPSTITGPSLSIADNVRYVKLERNRAQRTSVANSLAVPRFARTLQ
jgi:hypothetical protein